MNKTNNEPCTTVSTYIKRVNEILNHENYDGKIIVFRGEINDYKENCCIPNIFRTNYLENNPNFEKNLFDGMTANNISIGNTYLEKAISAQHAGFPSRLLDVTYNCLTALYFACTPHYTKSEKEKEEESRGDGFVYVLFLDKIFCPSASNITANYNDLIGNNSSFIKSKLFERNHKLIDHIQINKRIAAQQGAFILFQGNEPYKIPNRHYKKIKISSKKNLQKELKDLFGIHTGSIYPESENLKDTMIQKSNCFQSYEYNEKTEFDLLTTNLKESLNDSYMLILKNINNPLEYVEQFESIAYNFKLDIDNYKILNIPSDHKSVEHIEKFEQFYKNLIDNYTKDINKYLPDHICISKDDLL